MGSELKKLLNQIYDIHDKGCNQVYGDDKLPYSFHLKAVVAQVEKYYPNNQMLMVAGAGHDLIEDARMTYRDIETCFGTLEANIIYACTEEKGKNRDERHSDKFFTELALNRNAVFIKLCDIMANVLYSKLMNSSMYEKYKKEFPRVKAKLCIGGEYKELWRDLERELS